MGIQGLNLRIFMLFLLVFALMSFVYAELIPLVDRDQFVGHRVRLGSWNYEAGNRFTTSDNPPTITALGFIDMDNSNTDLSTTHGPNDGDGLLNSHRVTLWIVSTRTKIAEVTVPAGTGAILVDGYRYVNLEEPITLHPNTSYMVSAKNGSTDPYVDAVQTLIPNSVFVGSNTNSTFFYITPSNQYPTTTSNASTYYGLANVLTDAKPVPDVVSEDFAFYSSFDGTGPIYARAVYLDNADSFPLMAVQHGYKGTRDNVMYSAIRMAQRGYFCLLVDYRGCGGSAGLNDDGGIEVMDIYDGIRQARLNYPTQIDPDLTSIVGYSGGGGHTFFSTLRCPFLFRASLAFFGIVDYGQWAELVPSRQATVWPAVGGSPAEVPDNYFVRRAEEGASNLSGTKFHIAYDENEKMCPIIMDEEFIAAVPAEKLGDVSVHISLSTDTNRWLHSYNTTGHLNAMEDLFMDDIENNNLQTPIMPDAGNLIVLGYIFTPKFNCYFGSGADAAASVEYHFGGDLATFSFTPLTSDHSKTGMLTLLPNTVGHDVRVCIDGVESEIIPQGQPLEFSVGIGSVVKVCPLMLSDISGDCEVNMKDFAFMAECWLDICDLTNNWCNGADLDKSGIAEVADLKVVSDDWLTDF